jgi:hypothetical protein
VQDTEVTLANDRDTARAAAQVIATYAHRRTRACRR